MTPTLDLDLATVLIICASIIPLGPLFYWLLTDARPDPVNR